MRRIDAIGLVVLSGYALIAGAARLDAQSAPVGTGSLAGRVIGHDAGKPVAGARVNLSLDGRQLREIHTNANGEYVFPRLPRGIYQLRAYLPGFLHSSYGQSKPNRNGVPIVLGDGQALRDLTIRLFRGAVIAGNVYGHQGQPLVGADVFVYRVNYRPGGRFLDRFTGATTDDRGHYRVFGLSPGEYLVRVVNTSGGRMAIADRALDVQWMPSEGYVPTFFPSAPSPDASTSILLEAGEERPGVDISLPFTRLFRVGGRLQGTADPIASARFIRIFDDASELIDSTFDAQLGPDGQFVLADIPAGPLTVLVRASAGDRDRRDTGRRAGIESLWGLARFAVTGEIRDAVIVLQRAANVTGVVKFVGASPPVPLNFSMGVRQAGPSHLSGQILTGAIDRDGSFSIHGVAPGSYYLETIDLPSPWVLAGVTHDGVDLTATSISVTTDDVRNIEIKLANRGASLSGTVRSPVGVPTTTYTVIAFPASSAAWAARPRAVYAAAVDISGRYAMRWVLPGEYLVAVADDIETNSWFNPGVMEELSRGAVRVSVAIGESKVQDLRLGR